jgi:hypothetical protein
LVRTVKTDAGGAYRIEFLPEGDYKLEATNTGLKTYVQQGIVLTVNELDVKLAVAVTNEVVTVTELTPRDWRSPLLPPRKQRNLRWH